MKLRKTGLLGAVTLAAMTVAGSANAQLRDVTQTPNAINAGIRLMGGRVVKRYRLYEKEV